MDFDALRLGLRSLRRAAAGLVGASALVLTCAAGAYAGDIDGEQEENGEIGVIGTEEGQAGTVGAIKVPIPGPWTQRVYVPYCDANTVNATGRGVSQYETIGDVLCGGFSSCTGEGQNKWIVYSRPMNAQNLAPADDFEFDRGGVVCRSAPDASESEPPTISIADIMERARALAPTPTFVIEPAAKSYVNLPTNFAANVAPVTVNVTVLGLTVPVEFTPGNVTWKFGDGSTDSGLGVRHASVGQSGAVEHAYARSGAYDVTVTVGYTARILVPGGDPIEFPTPIARSAAPQSLTVGEIQSVVTGID